MTKRARAGQHRTAAHNRRKAGAPPAAATSVREVTKYLRARAASEMEKALLNGSREVNLEVGVLLGTTDEGYEKRLRQAIGRA